MNDKTRQRQKRGREPDEKTIFLCGDVRRRLLAAKLRNQLVKRCLATVTIFSHLYWLASDRLESSQSQKRLVVIR